MKKRRFGVSISEELARSLDELASALSTDRSSLVREALQEYLKDRCHLTVPHHCNGLLVVLGDPDRRRLQEIVSEHHDLICGYSHLHVGDTCVDVIAVSGPSARIASLHRELMKLPSTRIRYIPVKDHAI